MKSCWTVEIVVETVLKSSACIPKPELFFLLQSFVLSLFFSISLNARKMFNGFRESKYTLRRESIRCLLSGTHCLYSCGRHQSDFNYWRSTVLDFLCCRVGFYAKRAFSTATHSLTRVSICFVCVFLRFFRQWRSSQQRGLLHSLVRNAAGYICYAAHITRWTLLNCLVAPRRRQSPRPSPFFFPFFRSYHFSNPVVREETSVSVAVDIALRLNFPLNCNGDTIHVI